MELTLIRHGEVEGIIGNTRVHLGWGEFGLTEKGRQQALRTADKFQNTQFDLVISSDVKRAMETALLVFPHYSNQIETSHLLREVGCGELSGLSSDEASERFGKKYTDNPDRFDYTPFGGEHVKDMEKRARTFINNIEKLDDKKRIAVVTHGGPLRAIVAYILGLDYFTLGGRICFDNCSITTIKLAESLRQIKCLNNTDHLIDG